ncbi:uncharacterized protein [Maniola hyperantus]|uniref:uncharacterized protein isoform X2 n=1 Tax=Aphantopus hyperantus TaxID=2795564 RepID=UPI0015685FE4|nr:uncharacterized protein LOC117983566 isoform X2 [Maniola hyperantus]
MERIVVNDVLIREINDSALELGDSRKESADDMDFGRIMGMIPIFILLLIMFVRVVFVVYKSSGQKTRSTQQRRTFIAPRQRPSLSQAEPTIYVSPANLPPPPKYEALAPPSYEEVVGIHYPNYQPPVQPITQPITAALAQSSNSPDNVTNIESQSNAVSTVPSNVTSCSVITVTNERTTVTASS